MRSGLVTGTIFLLPLTGVLSSEAFSDELDVWCAHVPITSASLETKYSKGRDKDGNPSTLTDENFQIGEKATFYHRGEHAREALLELAVRHNILFTKKTIRENGSVNITMYPDGTDFKAELFLSEHDERFELTTNGWKREGDEYGLFLFIGAPSLEGPRIKLSYTSKNGKTFKYNYRFNYIDEGLFGAAAKITEELTCIDASHVKGSTKP